VERIRQGDTLMIRVSAPYSGYQHFGTRTITARPFIGISDGDMQDLERLVKRWFDGQ